MPLRFRDPGPVRGPPSGDETRLLGIIPGTRMFFRNTSLFRRNLLAFPVSVEYVVAETGTSPRSFRAEKAQGWSRASPCQRLCRAPGDVANAMLAPSRRTSGPFAYRPGNDHAGGRAVCALVGVGKLRRLCLHGVPGEPGRAFGCLFISTGHASAHAFGSPQETQALLGAEVLASSPVVPRGTGFGSSRARIRGRPPRSPAGGAGNTPHHSLARGLVPTPRSGWDGCLPPSPPLPFAHLLVRTAC
jgi:hypothetical protein